MRKETLNNSNNLETTNSNLLNSGENETLNTAYANEQTTATDAAAVVESDAGSPVAVASEGGPSETSGDAFKLSDITEQNISYIESDGSQYINLSNSTTNSITNFANIKVIVDYQLSNKITSPTDDDPKSEAIFGFNGGTVDQGSFCLYVHSGSGGNIGVGTNIYNADINNTDRYEITVPYNKAPTIINKTTGCELTAKPKTAIASYSPLDIYLFAANKNGVANYFSNIKLYSFKVLDNDEVIMNLVPRYYNGEYCLYDTITGSYFSNSNKDANSFTSDYQANDKKFRLTDDVALTNSDYPELNQLPQINGIELVGNKTLDELEKASMQTRFYEFDGDTYNQWTYGDISTTGTNTSNKVINSEFVDVTDKALIKIKCNKDLVARVAFYREDTDACPVSATIDWQDSFIIKKPDDCNFIKIMLKHEDDSEITDLDNSGESSMFNEPVNCTLFYANHPQAVVSILGDDMSTFGEGRGNTNKAPTNCIYNCPGNTVHYPVDDITDVNQMWWKQVLDHFGWQLGINESYAKSRITLTGTGNDNIYVASSKRINNLDGVDPTKITEGSEGTESTENTAGTESSESTESTEDTKKITPDIILIQAGGNDVNHFATEHLGTMPTDIMSKYENETNINALPVNTFYRAVTAMLLKLQHYYPTAKLLYILPYYYKDCDTCNSTPYTLKKFNDAAIEVCDCLGVDYVDLRKTINNSNIDTHLSEGKFPNSTGMNAIAGCVINKLKSLDFNA